MAAAAFGEAVPDHPNVGVSAPCRQARCEEHRKEKQDTKEGLHSERSEDVRGSGPCFFIGCVFAYRGWSVKWSDIPEEKVSRRAGGHLDGVRLGLPLQSISRNLRAMPRWLVAICLGACPVSFACNDELVDDVPQSVCYSGKQWIGGKRGSPNMYPGRDCVGCHLENDGPELMFGGTVYEYVEGRADVLEQLQTGEDCFGVAGATVRIEGGDGQIFEVVTNEAGNFYLEGKATDLVKPFTADVTWISRRPGNEGMEQNARMLATQPSYGGCARCHTPGQMPAPLPEGASRDQQVVSVARIGLTGEVNLQEALGGQ